jgi:hypothetical protein
MESVALLEIPTCRGGLVGIGGLTRNVVVGLPAIAVGGPWIWHDVAMGRDAFAIIGESDYPKSTADFAKNRRKTTKTR